MTYLLDTNACIEILNDALSAVALKLATVPRGEVALCGIVKAELCFGAFKSARPRANLRLLRAFFEQFDVLPFHDRAIRNFGRIRSQLALQGTPIGPFDLIIAATAVAHSVTLVTHNVREFSRVRQLRLEDWQA